MNKAWVAHGGVGLTRNTAFRLLDFPESYFYDPELVLCPSEPSHQQQKPVTCPFFSRPLTVLWSPNQWHICCQSALWGVGERVVRSAKAGENRILSGRVMGAENGWSEVTCCPVAAPNWRGLPGSLAASAPVLLRAPQPHPLSFSSPGPETSAQPPGFSYQAGCPEAARCQLPSLGLRSRDVISLKDSSSEVLPLRLTQEAAPHSFHTEFSESTICLNICK